jgi:hypothetical protein
MHSGRQAGDIIVAVALRNMLPMAPNSPAPALPLSCVKIIMESDLGFTSMTAAPVALRRPSAAGEAAAREFSTEAIVLSATSRQSSLRSSRQLVRQPSDRGSAAEIDAMPKHHAQWSPTVLEETRGMGDAQDLWPGEWAVYATRLYPGAAVRVGIHRVAFELGGRGCWVEYMLAELEKESPGQVVICGTPLQQLTFGLVGRDAPFGRLATAVEPGKLSMSLKQSMLPAVNVALSEPVGLLHVGSAVCVTASLTSTGVSSAQRTLTVDASFSLPRADVTNVTSAEVGDEVALLAGKSLASALPRAGGGNTAAGGQVALLAGESLASALPIPAEGVKLPILAKGVARSVHIWVVGIGCCEGDLLVGIEGAGPDALRRWHFEVLDPLMIEASLACDSGIHSIIQLEHEKRATANASLLGYVPAGALTMLDNLLQPLSRYHLTHFDSRRGHGTLVSMVHLHTANL